MSFAFVLFLAALLMLVAATATTGEVRVRVPARRRQAFRDRRIGASPPRR
jgi:hypothetical protein